MARSVSELPPTSALMLLCLGRCPGVAGRYHLQAGAVARWALRRAPRRKVITP